MAGGAGLRLGRGDGDLLGLGGEELHLEGKGPGAGGEIGEGVEALLVSDGGLGNRAIGGGDGDARDGEVVEGDGAVMLGGAGGEGEGEDGESR